MATNKGELDGAMTGSLVEFVSTELSLVADPERAKGAAAYMKTNMAFYGVTSPQRKVILRRVVRLFPATSVDEYRQAVSALWERPHREEKYLATAYARAFPEYVTADQIDLYRRMVVEGAWWDFVDEIAAHLIGKVVLDSRNDMRPILDQWIAEPDMWLRRSAILAQLRHKSDTDADMLFEFCRRCASEKEFFIRKAIGWALRAYAQTDPEAVRGFLDEMGNALSPLSRREAAKHL